MHISYTEKVRFLCIQENIHKVCDIVLKICSNDAVVHGMSSSEKKVCQDRQNLRRK